MGRQLCFVAIMSFMSLGSLYAEQKTLTMEQKKLHEDAEKKRQALLNTKNGSLEKRKLALEYAKALQLKQKNEAMMRKK
jgi:hypothetical protein